MKSRKAIVSCRDIQKRYNVHDSNDVSRGIARFDCEGMTVHVSSKGKRQIREVFGTSKWEARVSNYDHVNISRSLV